MTETTKFKMDWFIAGSLSMITINELGRGNYGYAAFVGGVAVLGYLINLRPNAKRTIK